MERIGNVLKRSLTNTLLIKRDKGNALLLNGLKRIRSIE